MGRRAAAAVVEAGLVCRYVAPAGGIVLRSEETRLIPAAGGANTGRSVEHAAAVDVAAPSPPILIVPATQEAVAAAVSPAALAARATATAVAAAARVADDVVVVVAAAAGTVETAHGHACEVGA